MASLFNSTEQLQDFVAVGSDLGLQTLKPYMRQVEMRYIFPALGRELWENLADNADNTEEYETVLDLARSALANLTLALYTQTGGAIIDNGGVYFTKTTNMWRPSDKDKADIQSSFYDAGMESLDELLVFLESIPENEESIPEFYTIWSESKSFEKFKALIIPTAADFSEHVQTFRNRATFASLFDLLTIVQRERIATVANDYLPTLLLKPEEEPATAIKAAACSALALLTVAKALRMGTYTRTELGFGTSVSKVENSKDLIFEYETDGQAALENFRSLLEQHKPSGYIPLPAEQAAPARSNTSGMVLA